MSLTKDLYPFQKPACRSMYDYLMGPSKDPVLVSLPTGSGKTLVLSAVTKYAGKKALMIVPNKELLEQNLEEAEEQGIKGIGVYSASAGRKEIGEYLTIATMGSVKTLGKKFKAAGIEVVFLDEAHIGTSWEGGMFKTFMQVLNPKKVIGLSGTLYRLHSTMAGSKLVMLNRSIPEYFKDTKYFKDIIHVTQINELTSGGYWTPLKYETYEFDNSGLILNSTGADYTKESIAEANRVQGVNNNTYRRVLGLIKQGYTSILVFCESVEVAETFAKNVPDSAALGSKTPKKERAKIISDFKSGKLKVIFNVKILTTGFNYKPLQAIIMSYSTNSCSLYTQIVGRLVRTHESKKEGLFIDFCGNVDRFGKVEDQTVENYPGYGWGVFSGEKLITGIPLKGGLTITKSDIDNKSIIASEEIGEDPILWFGKYEGQHVSYLFKYQRWYLDTILDKFDDSSPKIIALKRCIEKLYKKQILK